MSDACVLILAAGLSRRMRARNRLLLPVVVVTGHQAGAVKASPDGSTAQAMFNPDFSQGQPISASCGLSKAEDGRGILIGLGDQTSQTSDGLRTLRGAPAAANSARISIAMHKAQPGNPIVVPAALKARLLAYPRSPGCKKFPCENSDALTSSLEAIL